MKCEQKECESDAASAVGIAIYPPKSVMNYYKTDKWITRLILGLKLCPKHLAELNVNELLPRDRLELFARLIEQTQHIVVDLDGTKIVPVSFDDPEYQILLKKET